MSDHKEGLDYWHNEFKKMARTANEQASEIERLEAELEKVGREHFEQEILLEAHRNTNARLREALEPFAKFNDALKEWRFGPSKYLLQPARPEDKPFLRWAEPTPPPGVPGKIKMEIRVLEVWPQDFKRAEEALK